MTGKTRYWFPAKRYGWGWGLPTAWQGWVVLVLWFAASLVSAMLFLPTRIVPFQVSIGLLTAVLILVCYRTGERPSWRWGDRK